MRILWAQNIVNRSAYRGPALLLALGLLVGLGMSSAFAQDVGSLLRSAAHAAAQGDWRDAQRGYQKVLQIDPGNPQAVLGVAAALRGQGNLAQSQAMLEGLVAQHPNFQSAYYLLGLVYEAQGNMAGAKQAFQRYVNIAPGNIPADPQVRIKLRQLGVY